MKIALPSTSAGQRLSATGAGLKPVASQRIILPSSQAVKTIAPAGGVAAFAAKPGGIGAAAVNAPPGVNMYEAFANRKELSGRNYFLTTAAEKRFSDCPSKLYIFTC